MGKSKKLLKVYENPQKKSEGKLSTTNGCRCLAAAAVCNNSNSRPSTRRDEAWHKGGAKGARTLLQPLIFVCLGRRQSEKKRIPKFYCYTRKITTARERVRGEGEEGSATERRRRRRRRLQGVAFWLRFRFRRCGSQVQVEAYRRRLPGKVKGVSNGGVVRSKGGRGKRIKPQTG